MRHFLFSVIVPVYNTEQYIVETLESVIHQTIGFAENIQLILVNNATEDGSASICRFYQSVYPDNIVYVELPENRGPNGARMAGLSFATGEYINFLDSDDRWSINAFKTVLTYFNLYPQVDLIACRIKHFDAKNEYHILDYKFKSNYYVDINHDYNYPQLSLCSTFLRRGAIVVSDIDPKLHHAEDAKFLTKIILNRQSYLVLRDAVFFYRTRQSGSLLQSVAKSNEWYFTTPYAVYKEIQNYSIEKLGYNHLYVQYVAMYDLQFRFKTPIPDNFSDVEYHNYELAIHTALSSISDLVIYKVRNLNFVEKMRVYYVKYGKNFLNKITTDGTCFYFSGFNLFKADSQKHLEIGFIEINSNCILISGRLKFICKLEKEEFYIKNSKNKKIYPQYISLSYEKKTRNLGDCCLNTQYFEFKIPISAVNDTFTFNILFKNKEVRLGFSLGKFAPISNRKHDFYRFNNIILKLEGYQIAIYNCKKNDIIKYERNWLQNLRDNKRYKDIFCEMILPFLKQFIGKNKIWLFADRIERAGDNAEKLFKYVKKHKQYNIKPIFIISDKCKDYDKIKKLGIVVSPYSKLYKILYLISSKIITSYMDDLVIFPLGEHESYLRHHKKPQLVYLQHGIIKDDFSHDQNKFNKNVSMFVTSANLEKNSLLSLPYYYFNNEIKLTGLARYDDIYNLSLSCNLNERIIVFAPTWRANMNGNKWDSVHGKCKYNSLFRDSSYFKFWNALINDKRILKSMRYNKCKGVLRLHPVILSQIIDFDFNEYISAELRNVSYEQSICMCKLMITDYSSIAFDAAYIGIKTIYAQFDKDEFYLQQWYNEGYFNYETMGFGPVCYDYESTVEAIINAIENNCIMDEKYKQRIDDFFAYRDNKNCERIYQEILKLDGEK